MRAEEPTELASGVTFGGYIVRELIGRGGMASVYRAEHLLLNKPVALKLMARSLLTNSAARQRFVREGRAVAAIKHPNVVDITDVGVHEGVPYLVMELLRGQDLDTYLKQHAPLDDGMVTRLALPIIAALHAAHGSGVVHRDIKPSNIFLALGPDDLVVPKVLDFGLSKLSFETTRLDLKVTPQDHILGTPHYLPPEALVGPRELGAPGDQYSLGVVLYQCATGRTPFTGDGLIALLKAVSEGSFEPPRAVRPEISLGLERTILRAMSRNTSDRFPTIRDMGCALLELAMERTQMLWAQSFTAREHGDRPSLRLDALPAVTELMSRDRYAVPRRRRFAALAVAVAFIAVAFIAVASVAGLRALFAPRPDPSAQKLREPMGQAQPSPNPEPVSLHPHAGIAEARPGGSATITLHPVPHESPSADAETTVVRGLRPQTPGPSVRLLAAPAAPSATTHRSPIHGLGRRTTRAGRAPKAARSAVSIQNAAPIPPPSAPATSANTPPPARPARQGANRSPMLD